MSSGAKKENEIKEYEKTNLGLPKLLNQQWGSFDISFIFMNNIVIFFFFVRIPADLQNNENNLADGFKSTVENNTNEAESDIVTALANNNSMKSDNDSEMLSHNVEIDEVHAHCYKIQNSESVIIDKIK